MRSVRLALLAALAVSAYPLAAKTPTPAERTKTFSKLPDWGGYWITENDETSIGGISQAQLDAREGRQTNGRPVMSLFGFDAPYNEAGRAKAAAARKAGPARKAEGWGYPLMMNAAAPLQFIITPEEVLIINAYRDVRHIYTDGRKHPEPDDIWPTVWGDSVGHWEGDTLVVDTNSVKNPNYYFHGAPPLSDDAHYVERIRRVAPGKIEDSFTIEDPATLAKPWVTTITYTPAEGFDRMISIEFDNDRTGNDGSINTIEPPKDEK